MSARRPSLEGAKIKAALELVNGWELLEQLLGDQPNLEPFTYIAAGSSVGTPPNAPNNLIAGPFITDGDAEFYCLGLSLQGFSIGNPDAGEQFQGIGVGNNCEAWYGLSQIQEASGHILYSNIPCRSGHIFGTGIRPYLPPVPYIWKPGTSIRVFAQNNDVTSESLFYGFHGFKRYLSGPPLPIDFLFDPRVAPLLAYYRERNALGRIEPYAYGVNFDSRTNTAGYRTDQGGFTVADADFWIFDIMAAVTDPNAESYFNPADAVMRLSVNGGDSRLDDRPIALNSIAGSGSRPYRLSSPIPILRGGDLTALVTMLQQSTASDGNWDSFLTFAGLRVFPPGAGR